MAEIVKGLCYRNGRLLFLKDRRGRIDLPGGRKQNTETDHETLKREVAEETRLMFRRIDQTPLYVGRLSGRELALYFAEVDNGEVVLSREHKGYVWTDVSETLNYPLEKYVKDTIEARWFV